MLIATAIACAVLLTVTIHGFIKAERAHRRHRRLLNLRPEPTLWSDHIARRNGARIRTEARLGISAPVKGVRR